MLLVKVGEAMHMLSLAGQNHLFGRGEAMAWLVRIFKGVRVAQGHFAEDVGAGACALQGVE